MDASNIGVNHAVVFEEVRFRHIIDASPAVLSIAREIRYSVIAIVVGISTVAIARAFIAVRNPPKEN
ncbi:MAG: hypothetical protein M1823_001684 [Watsoniomyces obsoletus]|nr:MAG: hypothetical protein M1823_001684 [Watsoniomyces obsoletus]